MKEEEEEGDRMAFLVRLQGRINGREGGREGVMAGHKKILKKAPPPSQQAEQNEKEGSFLPAFAEMNQNRLSHGQL